MKKWREDSKAVPAGLLGLAVILIAASLAITPSASAWGRPPGAGEGPFKDLFEILNDEQKEQVKTILEEYRGEFKDADSDAERREIRDSLKAEIGLIISTDEQRQELDEALEKMEKHGPPDGARRFGRP